MLILIACTAAAFAVVSWIYRDLRRTHSAARRARVRECLGE